MKSFKKVVLISTILSSFLVANDEFVTKVTNFYNILTNGAIKFDATKSGDGYDLKVEPTNKIYKELFNPDAKIHISVDEGPAITKPKFTFGKAGLEATTDILSIFNKEIQKDIKESLKTPLNLKYEAIIGFNNNLEEKIEIVPFKIDAEDMSVDSAKVDIKTNVNLDKYTGDMKLKYDHFILKPKKEKGIFKVAKLEIESAITEPPIDNLAIFSKNMISINDIEFSMEKPQKVKYKFSLDSSSEIKKIDEKLLDFGFLIDLKTNDIDTIAEAKGVKEAKTNWLFKNLGTQGLVDLIKLNRELEEAQNELAMATNGKENEALAKYMTTMEEINNKLVSIFNSTLIKDKSKIIADLELLSTKASYIKLDLTYKAEPISGNLNSAFISLMAQGLSIVDGDIDIKLDKDLATTINPFALIVLDMLKSKGLASVTNGVYELKATLKGGNIIINGKSYTLQELSRTLF